MISSGTAFFLVFTALYLLESVVLCGGSAVLFRRGLTGTVKYRLAKNLPQFGKSRIITAQLFPPSALFLVTGSMPVILSPEGFCPVNGYGEGDEESFYSFNGINRIGIKGSAVTIDGRVVCKTHSEHEAELWKERLLCLARADKGERESEAFSILDGIFDSGIAEQFIASCADSTLFLSIMINMLFLYCFLVVPAVTWIFSIALTWPVLLSVFLIQVSVTVPLFVFSYRKIFPSHRIPWSRVISMALYTPSLLRCFDLINKTSLAACHPAAVARVVGNNEQLRELLSYYYREYTIAAMPLSETNTCDVISWYREHAAERILEAARKSGITRAELLAPPERKDEEIKTYCPLCHEQYVLESGTCSECGIKLLSYRNS